ncbi:MAG: TetR/AcrR family transcriptional regulator [Gammaproteobacteria bacterium]|nr:TetR/AcrR family transcriptional regulator [Gammaproteobacteria bacterium]
MPRIESASIEEHVKTQTARILDAATELFRTNGYRKTDMDDIARAVGLARNSLYRYYRNKYFILLACVERDTGAYVEQMRGLAALHPDPVERIGAWLDMQIDIATSPAHATLEHMAEIRSDAPELRTKLMELHEAPAAVLHGSIGEILRGKRRDTGLVAALIRGMVEAAAGQARRQENTTAVKRELRRSVERVLKC